MQITVDIPDDIAQDMFRGDPSTPTALLELAIYTALESHRLSERQASRLLGFDDRFSLHAVLARHRRELEAAGEEETRMYDEELAALSELRKSTAA